MMNYYHVLATLALTLLCVLCLRLPAIDALFISALTRIPLSPGSGPIPVTNAMTIFPGMRPRPTSWTTLLTLNAAIDAIENIDQFTSVTAASVGATIIIDFQKSKCAPCRKVAPAFQALADKYENKVKFYKVDADTSKDALAVLKANNIRSVPTFHVWKNAAFVDSVEGARTDDLEELLERNL